MPTEVREPTQAASLVIAIANGDRFAEEQLISTYYRGLYFILNRRTKNPHLSEDIAQEAFIIVIQKARAGAIQNPEAIASFVRQTGINLLIAHIRKETRRDTHCSDDIEIHPPKDQLDISNALHNQNVMALVQQVMTELPTDRDRDLLRNYFVYDKNKQQICQELNLSPEHFDRVLFRARQRLKQLIKHKLALPEHTKDIFTVLSLSFICALIYQAAQPSAPHLFLAVVRENPSSIHLLFKTHEPSSRFILARHINHSEFIGAQLTPKSRSV